MNHFIIGAFFSLYLLDEVLISAHYFDADTSSASEDEGSLRRQGRLATTTPYQGHSHPAVEHWFNRVIQGSSTSSSASSTSSHPGGRSVTNSTAHAALNANATATALADLMAHTQLGQWRNRLNRPFTVQRPCSQSELVGEYTCG